MQNSAPAVTFGTDPNRYRGYLLRLWREAAGTPWRCQVRCVGSGRVLRFDSARRLFEFLEAELGHADWLEPGAEDSPLMDEDRPEGDAAPVGKAS